MQRPQLSQFSIGTRRRRPLHTRTSLQTHNNFVGFARFISRTTNPVHRINYRLHWINDWCGHLHYVSSVVFYQSLSEEFNGKIAGSIFADIRLRIDGSRNVCQFECH